MIICSIMTYIKDIIKNPIYDTSEVAGEILILIFTLPIALFLDILISPYSICYLIAYLIRKRKVSDDNEQ